MIKYIVEYTCDCCLITKQRTDGLPENWVEIIPESGLTDSSRHFCSTCVEALKSHES